MTRSERQALIDRGDSHLSIARQCQLLKVARSTLYYRPAPVSDDDLAVMRRLDEQYLVTPFYGARRMAVVLRRDGLVVNRKRIRRLMQVMGIEAIYQKPNTSRRHPDLRCRQPAILFHPRTVANPARLLRCLAPLRGAEWVVYDNNQRKTTTLAAEEFIRRFLMHV